jgi:hypothetical protein
LKFLEKLMLRLLPELNKRLVDCEYNCLYALNAAAVALKQANECDECSACNEPVAKGGDGGFKN